MLADDLKQAMWIDRRRFIAAAGAAFFAPLFARPAWAAVRKQISFDGNPFSLGIASGDPDDTSVVLWTRLAPKPIQGGGMPNESVEVGWELSEDEGFSRIVRQGKEIAVPQLAHSVHVEPNGLEPGRTYWYRFHAGSETSPVGRTRTMPARHSEPQRLLFSFASCQHYESGHYTAYEHMVKDDLDLIFHLGDYIYEGGPRGNAFRKHNSPEIVTLVDYRNRHALYKTDAHLQTAHRLCPWVVTWDDHEVENNYAGHIEQDEPGNVEAFLRRRANAYQAYYEHMPLRRSALPSGPNLRLYRRIRFGNLAEFSVLDTRQYRSDQPNGDGTKPLTGDVLNPEATMLGSQQENWLYRGLIQSAATWNVLAQQVMVARVGRGKGPETTYSMDKWSGYDVPRKRLLEFLATRRVPNPIVLTGDIHSNWCNDLLVDFDRPEDPVVASEFVGTSISSGGDGVKEPPQLSEMLANNPFVKFHNQQRGYVRCTMTPKTCQADYQVVEYVSRPGAPIETKAAFVLEAGVPGIKPA